MIVESPKFKSILWGSIKKESAWTKELLNYVQGNLTVAVLSTIKFKSK